MRTFGIIILAGLILAGLRAGATEVEFEGPAPHNAERVKRLIERGVSVDSVTTVLQADGYLEPDVTHGSDGWWVKAGERFTLAEITFVRSGDTTATNPNTYFTQPVLNGILDSALGELQRSGYYFASAVIVSLLQLRTSVSATVQLTPGPLVVVDDIRMRGLRRSRRDVIERYLPLQSGDVITASAVNEASRAADDIPFVRHLPPPVVRPKPGYTAVDVEFNFEEQRPLSLELGGGYVPDQEAEIVWYFNGTLNNLFGGGREARLLSERREEGRQILQIGYGQPLMVFGVGLLSLQAATRDYRESFYEFELTGAYETRFGPDLKIGVSPGFRSVEPVGAVASFSSYRIGFTADWERTDDRFNPRSGFSARTAIAWSHRRYASDSSGTVSSGRVFNETRTDLHIGGFRPLIGPLVGHVSLRYQGLETGEQLPPLSELILVGGPGSLRGYRNEQFAVLRTAMVTVEPRLRFDTGYLFAFYDGAYLNDRAASASGVSTDEDYRSGYGLGLGLSDGRRSIRLALGWNPDIRFDEARLSIRLISDI